MTAPYYADEDVTLYLGDCREIIPQLPEWSVDLLLTDPPYAAAAATMTTGFAKEKWGGNWGDMSLVSLLAELVIDARVLTPGHQAFWFCDHLSYAALVPSFFRRYALVQSIVWDKDVLGVGAHFRKQTEFIIYARKADSPVTTSTSLRDLVRYSPDYASKEHAAQKPLPLILHFATATAWRTVLDPFAGSGTTLVAAKQLGRRAVGIEIEERFCEIAARRLSRAVAGSAPKPLAPPVLDSRQSLFEQEAG